MHIGLTAPTPGDDPRPRDAPVPDGARRGAGLHAVRMPNAVRGFEPMLAGGAPPANRVGAVLVPTYVPPVLMASHALTAQAATGPMTRDGLSHKVAMEGQLGFDFSLPITATCAST